MNKLKFSLLALFIFLGMSAFSQLQTKGNTIEYLLEANKVAQPGTYEIMPSKIVEQFTADGWNHILIQIELKRDEFEEIFWQVTPYTRIRIIPRSQITE